MELRFGAVVTCGLSEKEENAYLRSIEARVEDPFDDPEREEVDVITGRGAPDGLAEDGSVLLAEATPKRLQVVGLVLAKSALLAHYEARVEPVFERVEEFAKHLRAGKIPARRAELLNEIGNVLLIRIRTLGRAEVSEKPELTWEEPDLDTLYERLEADYELRDRDLALARKLDVIASASEQYLELLHNRSSLRVEWYIVILILVEIVISLYEMMGSH